MRYFFPLTLLISPSLFALVSIAPVDIGSKPGWSGNINGSIGSKSGNTEKDEYSLGTRIQFDEGENYLTWGTLTYDYATTRNVKNEDKLYAHLRYLHLIDHAEWVGELYAQTERDQIRDISERTLGGGGIRWRIFNSSEYGKGYAGLGAFAESVRYSHSQINPDENNQRLNSYLAYTKQFDNGPKFSYVGYYQPRFDKTSDYVSLQTVELLFPLYGKLNLALTAQYNYDSHPAIGIRSEDTVFKTSFVFGF